MLPKWKVLWVTRGFSHVPCGGRWGTAVRHTAAPSLPVTASQARTPGGAGLSPRGTELSRQSTYLSLPSCGPCPAPQPGRGSSQTPGCIFTSRRGPRVLARRLQGRRVNHWVRRVGRGRRRAAHCSLGPTLSEALPAPYTHPLPAQETREPDQPPPQASTGLSRSLEGAGGWRLAQPCRHPRVGVCGVWEFGVRPSALSSPVPSPAPAAQGCEGPRGHRPACAWASASLYR